MASGRCDTKLGTVLAKILKRWVGMNGPAAGSASCSNVEHGREADGITLCMDVILPLMGNRRGGYALSVEDIPTNVRRWFQLCQEVNPAYFGSIALDRSTVDEEARRRAAESSTEASADPHLLRARGRDEAGAKRQAAEKRDSPLPRVLGVLSFVAPQTRLWGPHARVCVARLWPLCALPRQLHRMPSRVARRCGKGPFGGSGLPGGAIHCRGGRVGAMGGVEGGQAPRGSRSLTAFGAAASAAQTTATTRLRTWTCSCATPATGSSRRRSWRSGWPNARQSARAASGARPRPTLWRLRRSGGRRRPFPQRSRISRARRLTAGFAERPTTRPSPPRRGR